jgi:DNA polymerase phi
MTAAQMKETLKDGLQFCRFTKRFAADSVSLSSIWKPEDWDDLAKQLEASPQFKSSISLAATCRQISKLATTSDGKATLKRKAEAEGLSEAKVGNDKAKRRKAKKA